jgi:hypothetical protein
MYYLSLQNNYEKGQMEVIQHNYTDGKIDDMEQKYGMRLLHNPFLSSDSSINLLDIVTIDIMHTIWERYDFERHYE